MTRAENQFRTIQFCETIVFALEGAGYSQGDPVEESGNAMEDDDMYTFTLVLATDKGPREYHVEVTGPYVEDED